MKPQEQALNLFGEYRQLLKCAEEAAELAAAINRYLAHPSDKTEASVIEEAADVENCGAYLRMIFGAPVIAMVAESKLARLQDNLNNNFNFGV